MNPARIHCVVLVTAVLLISGCGELPSPRVYDHAMLRQYFGKTAREVEDAFGTAASSALADPKSPPAQATAEEQRIFQATTENLQQTYATPDGDLVFHYNLLDEVFAITYAGQSVAKK